jgi:hypothetical protein
MKFFKVLLPLFLTFHLLVSANAADSGAQVPKDKDNFHLFLLAGQSNMAGRGKIEPEDLVPHPRVLMLTEDREWVPAVAPIHFDKTVAGVGLAQSFAVALAEADPSITIGLIPAACGGSPISTWEPGGYHLQTHNPPYDDAISRARNAMKDGTLKGILWHQGESDCKPGLADVYQRKLVEMINRFRSDLRIDDLPVIIGQLAKFAGKPWDAERVQVDKAHQAVAKGMDGVAFVTSEDLTPNEDLVHFDTNSLRIFGKRYAKAYLKTDEEVEEERGKLNRFHRSGFARKPKFD